MLNKNDLEFLSSLGITKKEIDSQIDLLLGKTKIKTLKLMRPCVEGDGIISPNEVDKLNVDSGSIMSELLISRFIPASGSATRMFALDRFKEEFFAKLHLLPFYSKILDYSDKNEVELNTIIKNKDIEALKEILTSEDLINFSRQPKGLIDFHLFDGLPISPVEEFVLNSIDDITNSKIYFTVQEGLEEDIRFKINKSPFLKKSDPESLYELMIQPKSTNSLCLDDEGELLRKENGDIYTHPSGHGALLDILNDVNSDFVFINNIDNISSKTRLLRYEVSEFLYKIAHSTKKRFDLLLETFNERNYELLEPSIAQLENSLPTQFKSKPLDKKVDLIIQMLNKPIRVCGVVRDEKASGGKPFWVHDGNSESVQIVEESQINLNDENQKNIWDNCGYFNPVEMICSTKDYMGKKFDLREFAEEGLKIRVQKSVLGKECSFIELPGLWNGSMHYWHTTFVEIPLETFTPVKNFTDLFLPIHQP
jgi:hypothetical protein|tara:strand:- start:6 stop:1445 length:1440 start_codon:yes stop_codon:yes gene_type:complete